MKPHTKLEQLHLFQTIVAVAASERRRECHKILKRATALLSRVSRERRSGASGGQVRRLHSRRRSIIDQRHPNWHSVVYRSEKSRSKFQRYNLVECSRVLACEFEMSWQTRRNREARESQNYARTHTVQHKVTAHIRFGHSTHIGVKIVPRQIVTVPSILVPTSKHQDGLHPARTAAGLEAVQIQ